MKDDYIEKDTDDLEEIHKLAVKRFKVIEDAERDQRAQAVEDMRFAHVEGGQWDDDANEKRKGRPRYTINRIAGALDQVTGDQRQTRNTIKIKPESSDADEDKAEIFSGLIRNIESKSNAGDAYDMAFDEGITGGYGGWRVVTEYNQFDIFEQDIRIEPILSATTSLWFDLSARRYDKSDAKYAFVTSDMQLEDYEEEFPDAQPINWSKPDFDWNQSWYNREDNTVRVAEYWCKKPITQTMALLSDGRVINKDEEADVIDELKDRGVEIIKEREVETFEVVSYLMNGGEILEGPMEWAGRYIPLIPYYGKMVNIDGKWYVRGLVRNAKDPQRIYNYATSAAIETSALTPKDPIWITATQAKGFENKLQNFNVNNDPFMLYNPDPTAPGIPQRGGAPAVQGALLQQISQAATDIHSTTGLEPASLGNVPELKSGKAILAQQAMGDRGSFIFQDNLSKSIEHTARILVDLLPRIYDTERIVRVMKLDGTTEQVEVNKPSIDNFNQTIIDEQTQKPVIVNDLTVGKYDVSVSTGPQYNTQRQESAQQLIDLAGSNPVFAELTLDLIAKNLDVLENDEITRRLRKRMIAQGVVEPTEDEVEDYGLDQPTPPDPVQVALVENTNLQTEKLISDIQTQEQEQLRKDAETEAKIAENFSKMLQEQQKHIDDLAMKLTQMEIEARRQLNSEVESNKDEFDKT